MPELRWPPIRSIAAVVVAAALALGACGGDGEREVRGIVREPLPDVSGPVLPDASADGEGFSFVADEGHVLLAYFGYTHCPDVCPTTLADVRTAREELGDDAERVDLAMATVDPVRDTGELLTDYVRSFVPDAHALTTTDDVALRSAADAFGADYSVDATAAGEEPEVSHTGFLYAVDDQGRLLVTWSFGTPAEDVTHDLEILLADA